VGWVGRGAKRIKRLYQCYCMEGLGSVVALIEQLDPDNFDNCQKVLQELIFGEEEEDGESFTQLCSRLRQRTLVGLGLQTTRFSHQSGLLFLRSMWANIGDLVAFRVKDGHYKVSTFNLAAIRIWQRFNPSLRCFE